MSALTSSGLFPSTRPPHLTPVLPQGLPQQDRHLAPDMLLLPALLPPHRAGGGWGLVFSRIHSFLCAFIQETLISADRGGGGH